MVYGTVVRWTCKRCATHNEFKALIEAENAAAYASIINAITLFCRACEMSIRLIETESLPGLSGSFGKLQTPR